MKKGLSDSTLLALWRKAVRARWEARCAFCGADQECECHHIVPRHHRLLRFDVRNGLLLCKHCHRLAQTLTGHELLKEVLDEREEGDFAYLILWEAVRYRPHLKLQGKTDKQWREQERRELEDVDRLMKEAR